MPINLEVIKGKLVDRPALLRDVLELVAQYHYLDSESTEESDFILYTHLSSTERSFQWENSLYMQKRRALENEARLRARKEAIRLSKESLLDQIAKLTEVNIREGNLDASL